MNANTTTLLIKKTQMKRERNYFPSTRLAALKHNVNAL